MIVRTQEFDDMEVCSTCLASMMKRYDGKSEKFVATTRPLAKVTKCEICGTRTAVTHLYIVKVL